ncbi:MAG: ribose ABC transporter permease [Peptostreptococcus sp.]|uniref:ABC transporter permease subunit n=1 Tax=Peptostreptococcus sp. TaxID=1262 RepID=UPI002FC5E880
MVKTKMKNKDLGILGPIIALIVLMIFVTILNPSFIKPSNLINLLRQVSVNALIAFGMSFVILTGGIDLSVGSVLALTSAIFAGVLGMGVPPMIGVVIALAVGALLGAINGILITKGKMAPFIATLATMTIFRGLTLVYTGGNPITNFSDAFSYKFIGRGYVLGVPWPVILMIIFFAIAFVILNKTPFGRKTYAIGGNEKASFISGIKTDSVKIKIYAISGFLAAMAGLILTSRLNSAQPTAGTAYEMDAIAAVVLGGISMSGGKGSIAGTLVGALILGTLNNGLNMLGVSSFYQQIVKGIVILIAVLIDRKRNK